MRQNGAIRLTPIAPYRLDKEMVAAKFEPEKTFDDRFVRKAAAAIK